MDEGYGARYAELYRAHWWWRAREEALDRLLRRLLGAGRGSGVAGDGRDGELLDFGCGDGLFFPVLERYGTPHGIEPDARLLDPAGPWRSRISTDPLVPDPKEAGRYRLIVALDVLEHIDDPRPVVSELARRLAPGGWFVATVPAFQSLWTAHDDLNHHVRRYRLAELEALLSEPGLEIVESRYFFSWLAILKWIVARVERVVRPEPKPPAVPFGPFNAAALAVSRIEQRLLGDSHPPFGSSALVVARRRT
ncbi:MAG: class I SAM-dependent methyltransferase [Gemmatimonadetes bacterium]|nr:class I SAM-dependent methyltransferase [Gemmatimonadota bacterium]